MNIRLTAPYSYVEYHVLNTNASHYSNPRLMIDRMQALWDRRFRLFVEDLLLRQANIRDTVFSSCGTRFDAPIVCADVL